MPIIFNASNLTSTYVKVGKIIIADYGKCFISSVYPSDDLINEIYEIITILNI